MAFTVTSFDYNDTLYTAAYRTLPTLEIGIQIPNELYYVQYINNEIQIYKMSILPKSLHFGDIIELEEPIITHILNAIYLIDDIRINVMISI
jgi:hypothetical protein